MTVLQPKPVTQRNLKTHFQAFVDPSFPSDNFWSLHGYSPSPKRGKDVTMVGELSIADGETTHRTGNLLTGAYDTYWSHYTHGGVALAMINKGSRAIGAVSAGTVHLKGSLSFTVTIAQVAQEAQEAFSMETRQAYGKVSNIDAIICPLGFDIQHVSIDVLVDEKHNLCGYIFNGEDEFTFEERILPLETSRISAYRILEQFALAPRDSRLEVVTSDGTRLGALTSLDPVATWQGNLGGSRLATAGDAWDEASINVTDAEIPAGQLGMRVSLEHPKKGNYWVGKVEVVDGAVLLHLLEATPLPDRQLTISDPDL